MSPLLTALNGMNLEDLKRECNPKETVEIKIYWQLEDLDRLGRSAAYLKKSKPMKQNQNQNPEHKPTNVVDNETIFSIKLMELETGLPALLEDTMKPETYKRFVEHMNKNGKK